MPFDENLPPDIEDVLQAAAVLDVTEYELFHLAYLRWHGERADEQLLERRFAAYMFRRVVPVWVRHFARLVHSQDARGELDPSALGVTRLPRTREMVRRGTRFGVAIVTTMTALFIFVEFAARVLGIGEVCMFPPCY
ncbi:MAG: hypothetical protein GWN84_15375 [Gammaproteobacteria bacterium]|nr:hypothetical protein [Gammaproteobacteria bacterium]NIR84173.1 hypothetical protein [Gammaproteobacteria bacterium]NIR89485.1 hypothetical protein [Gammaproteobacteria bacterium]NIU05328.1 hypothetical protein [Gammaproteobacteria bacterium]NIV52268.1 hypothetical protein [Gammaproteobacteria bacterium]